MVEMYSVGCLTSHYIKGKQQRRGVAACVLCSTFHAKDPNTAFSSRPADLTTVNHIRGTPPAPRGDRLCHYGIHSPAAV